MEGAHSELSISQKEFKWFEGLAICLSMIGVQLCSEVINQWGLYFYSPSKGIGRTIYVSISIVGYIFIIGTIWDAFSSPIVGVISDKTPTRPGRWRIIPIYGRRRPYIFFGALLMVFTMISFWYPPIQAPSIINFLYATFILCTHWTLFSITVIPLNALGPEIARSEPARIALGTWTAVGMIVGLAFANALPGILIAKLDPARVESHLSIETTIQTAPDDLIKNWFSQLKITNLSKTDIKITGNSIEIKGATLEQIKESLINNRILSLIKSGGVKDIQRLPRKSFWAYKIAGENIERNIEFVKKELFALLIPYAEEILGVQKEQAKNILIFQSKLIEQIKKENITSDFITNPNVKIKINNDLLIIELDNNSIDFDALVSTLLKIAIDKNLTTPHWAENTVVITKPLAAGIAKIEVQESLKQLGNISKITWVEESFSPVGYRRVALIFSIASLILFLLPVAFIRERYDSEAIQSEPLPWGEGLKDAFKNIPFLIYAASFFLFTIGFLAVQRVLPYWVELGLDGDESTITFLLIPFILVAVASYAVIPKLAKYMHMKWFMFIALGIIASGMPFLYVIGKANFEPLSKTIAGMLLFGYCGIGQAIIYVMMIPMLGDIIDYDESFSGQRREAVYNGLSAFIWKASMAGSILLASQSMHYWGNSIENFTGVLLVGPFAGLFGFLGMILITLYPSKWREKLKVENKI